MKKVIFIAGMYGGKRDQFILQKILKNFKVIYFPYNTKLYETFETIAKQLDYFIKNLNLKKDEKVSIVGVSAGGIISDYYLKFIDIKRVNKIAIIYSPFKGTYLTHLFSKKRKGIHQINYSSKFLNKLNSKKIKNVKIISFWSFLDPLIPGTSGKYKNSHHSLFFLHWIVQFWPPILYKIKNFFTTFS